MWSRTTGLLRAQRIPAIAQTARQASAQKSFSTTIAAFGLFKDYVTHLKSTSVEEITPAELNAKLTHDPVTGPLPSFHLLDVRETYEWNEEHIPCAVYTGRGCLERDIEGIIPDVQDEIVVYCAGGHRSVLAADSLQKLGYKNVKSLQGGLGQWKNQGMSVQQNN
ncbi:hypothetical protein SeLEV6574_g03171 [Synchytrium endobioticum]|uniref:Rhodanese domain-containing protein n=1 Tax=Synchytrium endobioticum TaxID=286115 RepID=A0A507D4W9_9FUNG|nr:hypothetical protein SeLEV6574_g03171 [Synchytrium endobioticum]